MDSKKTSIFLWPIVTFIGLLIYKDYLLGQYQHELYINIVTDGTLLLLMFMLAVKRTSKLWRSLQAISAILIIAYHWLDTCIYIALQNRLTFNNVIANVNYLNDAVYFISTKLIIFTLAVLILPLILRKKTLQLAVLPTTTNFVGFQLLFVMSITHLVIVTKASAVNVDGGAIDLTNNSYSASSIKSDSLSFIQRQPPALLQSIEDIFSGKTWSSSEPNNPSSEKPNIVIVLSESLSMVDSKYAGGLFDRLPHIDQIQQEGLVFTNTVANGKVTAQGLASTILGIQANKLGGYKGMLDQFPPQKFAANNIIDYAKKAGYETIIMSPVQLPSFYQMEEWFQQVGFDQIIDINAAVYNGKPRFTWNAPSDQAMYQAALDMLPTLKKPYFLIVENISLHEPYIIPDLKYRIGDKDLLNQINYVDNTLYDFYAALKKQEFFNNGVFLLFGDHRRFEPLEQAELDDSGYSKWHERIVCSIVGKGIAAHSITKQPFSLVDMNTLLHYMVDGKPVNDNTILQAGLGHKLGSDTPFNISLVDDSHGTYLIRSENNPPMYISIYGKVDFDKIPNSAYKDATTYLIKNDQQTTVNNSIATSNGNVL